MALPVKKDEKGLATQNFDTMKDLLAKYKGNMERVLPKHITPERLVEIALYNVRTNPKLMECDKASVLASVLQAAMLGIIPGDGTRKGDLIPYFNGKKQRMECSFQPRYGGLIAVAKNGNPNEWGRVEKATVHEKDFFEYEKGTTPYIKHIPSKEQDPGPATHFYSIVFLKDGTFLFEVITKKEADEFMNRSKAKDSGPWKTDYEEMAEIRPLKRVLKLLPWASESLHKAVELSERVEAGEPQDNIILLDENELGTVQEKQLKAADPVVPPTPSLGKPVESDAQEQAALSDFKAAIDGSTTAEEVDKFAAEAMANPKLSTDTKTLIFGHAKAKKKKLTIAKADDPSGI